MACSRSISNATVVNNYELLLNTEKDLKMREEEVLKRAFAMPLTSPSYPRGPYRFVNREYLIITYRTDPVKLRAVVPGPLDIDSHEAL
jgi:Acetoacetate decarboxylase (ADC)